MPREDTWPRHDSHWKADPHCYKCREALAAGPLVPSWVQREVPKAPEVLAAECMRVASDNLKLAMALCRDARCLETADYLRTVAENLNPAFDALSLEVGLVSAQTVMQSKGSDT